MALRSTVGGMLVILCAAWCPAAGGEGGSPRLRPDVRRAPADDPGVLLLTGPGAESVRRAWFGAEESPAVLPWLGAGTTVAVPAGEPDARVPLVVEFEDGSRRRLGRFLLEGPFRGGRRSAWTGGGVTCGGATRPGARGFTASTRSRVRRERDGTYRYDYEFRSGGQGSLVLRWETLEPLGFRGGIAWYLSAGERVRMARTSESGPVVVRGDATADDLRGCAGPREDAAPGSSDHRWSSPAHLAGDLLPDMTAPGDLAVEEAGGGQALATWSAPPGGGPDAWEVVARYLAPGAIDGAPVHAEWAGRFPGGETRVLVPCGGSGAATVSVRPLLRGVPGPVAVAVVPRR